MHCGGDDNSEQNVLLSRYWKRNLHRNLRQSDDKPNGTKNKSEQTEDSPFLSYFNLSISSTVTLVSSVFITFLFL